MNKLDEFQKNLLRVTNEYKKFKEQDNSTVTGVVDASGQPIKVGTPEPQPKQTTWTDTAKSWDKWSQENPMARTVMGFVPGVAQVAGAADVASSAIQGDMPGAIRNLPGAFTGATQKQLDAGIAAYDSLKQGDVASAAKNSLTVSAAGGSQRAAQAAKAIGIGQNVANLPQTAKSIGSTVKTLAGNKTPNQAGTTSGSIPTTENTIRKFINIVSESKNKNCPTATYDIDVNLKNRQKAIDDYHYGPANPDHPENYWKELADIWKIKESTAKTMKCENCGAFDVSDDMRKCIEDGIHGEDNKIADARAPIDLADLGYCTFLKFKCAGSRSCSAFIVGGPITKD
jgi:hypothetical protein